MHVQEIRFVCGLKDFWLTSAYDCQNQSKMEDDWSSLLIE